MRSSPLLPPLWISGRAFSPPGVSTPPCVSPTSLGRWQPLGSGLELYYRAARRGEGGLIVDVRAREGARRPGCSAEAPPGDSAEPAGSAAPRIPRDRLRHEG